MLNLTKSQDTGTNGSNILSKFIMLGILVIVMISLAGYLVDKYVGTSKETLNMIITEQKVAIDKLVESNKTLNETIEEERKINNMKLEEVNKALAVLTENYEFLKETQMAKNTQIESVVSTKVKITNNVLKLSEKLTKEEEDRISNIQINNIWNVYSKAVGVNDVSTN